MWCGKSNFTCLGKSVDRKYRIDNVKLKKRDKKEDNPTIATYLIILYAKYDLRFILKILNEIEKIIELKLDAMNKKITYLHNRESGGFFNNNALYEARRTKSKSDIINHNDFINSYWPQKCSKVILVITF